MTADENIYQIELNNQMERENQIIEVFDKKLEMVNVTSEKALKNFIEIENQLDNLDTEDEDNGRRRKSSTVKNFEFQGVPNRVAVEDLNQIYEGSKEIAEFGPGNFRKGDVVNCVIDRRKIQGTVISVNQRGLLIVTKDRKKVRISWDEIEDEEAEVSKVTEE
jgi:hypothetical protein